MHPATLPHPDRRALSILFAAQQMTIPQSKWRLEQLFGDYQLTDC